MMLSMIAVIICNQVVDKVRQNSIVHINMYNVCVTPCFLYILNSYTNGSIYGAWLGTLGHNNYCGIIGKFLAHCLKA